MAGVVAFSSLRMIRSLRQRTSVHLSLSPLACLHIHRWVLAIFLILRVIWQMPPPYSWNVQALWLDQMLHAEHNRNLIFQCHRFGSVLKLRAKSEISNALSLAFYLTDFFLDFLQVIIISNTTDWVENTSGAGYFSSMFGKMMKHSSVFDISSLSKLKLCRKRRNKSIKIHASHCHGSDFLYIKTW